MRANPFIRPRAFTIYVLAVAACTAVAAPTAVAEDGFARPGVDYDPTTLLVGYNDAETHAAISARYTDRTKKIGPKSAVVHVPLGTPLAAEARRIARQPGVRFVKPNYRLRTSAAFVPNDPGKNSAGGWQQIQWNFAGTWGVNAPRAWDHVRNLGAEGGRGVIVAVIDTGVAYERRGIFRRSPDLAGVPIRSSWDFIDHDRHANDRNGHGTHVASTIVEQTNNGIGVTGLAYGATLMPLRALDGAGVGDERTVAKAIRYAADRRADIINMSVEFDVRLSARDLPVIVSAMRYARRKGSLVIGAAGNQGARQVAYPARSIYAVAVGATTIHGCLADYSDVGNGLDLVAPGGGADSGIVDLRRGSTDIQNCNFTGRPAPIYQMTFGRSYRRFGLPSGYEGTSMATPHVSATAALVIASGVLGPDPTPEAVLARLQSTARDVGYPGFDARYGHGLVDAAAAVGAP
ncbi:MAG TPA: S8 family serine peptidase [Solirubrobacterales bacterium]|nr:S8 family serine peptidase [Solirubrobacterales bacterium]